MKYMGSKNRHFKRLSNFILKDLENFDFFVEPFCGGCNFIDKVEGVKRIASDSNKYLIAFLNELVNNPDNIPRNVTRNEYKNIKDNKEDYPDFLVGHVGFNCSYSGKFFGGYAGKTKTKKGVRDYQDEAYRNIIKQRERLKGVEFICSDFEKLHIPSNSLIYCDPPYSNTTGYEGSFNKERFIFWLKSLPKSNKIFVSEYNMPDCFLEVTDFEVRSSLSANGKSGKSKKSTEKLFLLK